MPILQNIFLDIVNQYLNMLHLGSNTTIFGGI